MWALQYGEAYEVAMKGAGGMPDHLSPPDLLPGADVWLSAFWELSTDRQIGMAAGPIPAASIARHTAGWADVEAEGFRRCIRAMDRAYLEAIAPGPDGKPKQRPDPAIAASDNPARDVFRAVFG